ARGRRRMRPGTPVDGTNRGGGMAAGDASTRSSLEKFHAWSIADREGFWAEQAGLIDWQVPFERVLDYANPPFARWFVGGRTNLCHNAIDRHLATRRDSPALIHV